MVPAVESTMACLMPTSLLNKVLLPTLGRPTIATMLIVYDFCRQRYGEYAKIPYRYLYLVGICY